jgi:hypothetical protein
MTAQGIQYHRAQPRKTTVKGDANDAEHPSYRYFILGSITPVRLTLNPLNHVTGAQVPGAG